MSSWIRLWTEMLHDPKVVLLNDEQHRFWVDCLLMAGTLEKQGALGTAEDVACITRKSTGDTRRLLAVFQKANMVTRVGTVWMITNFAKRQYLPPSALPEATRERQRQCRTRKGVTRVSREPVTACHNQQNRTEQNRSDQIRTEEIEPGILLSEESIIDHKVIGGPQIKKTRSEKQKANDLIHDAIAEVTKSPPGSFSGKVTADLRKELPDKAPEYIAAEVRRRFGAGGLWYSNDFRGKKGDFPRPQQIYQEWDRVLGGGEISVSKHNEGVIDQLIANGREKRNAR